MLVECATWLAVLVLLAVLAAVVIGYLVSHGLPPMILA